MLLPSGFANTRCLACRFEPRSLHVPTPSRARNGFAEPRDRQPKSTLSRPQPAAETARPHLNLRKRPQIAGVSASSGVNAQRLLKDPFASVRMLRIFILQLFRVDLCKTV